MTDVVNDDGRLLSRAQCDDIAARATRYASGGGTTDVQITSWWSGELRWARNQIRLSSDRRNLLVTITRAIGGTRGGARTNQIDDLSIASAVQSAERVVGMAPTVTPSEFEPPPPVLPVPSPRIWSDATYAADAAIRGAVGRIVLDGVDRQGMRSAGFLRMYASTVASAAGLMHAPGTVSTYQRYTLAECSMTVRSPQGTGSGWAGESGYDWTVIDAPVLAARALRKCLASVDPSAVEPGRYTVVLEPQAVYALVQVVVSQALRQSAESGSGPFTAGFDSAVHLYRSKLGMRVADERVTIRHDPMDPRLGIVPSPGMRPVTWIDHGVLTALADTRGYTLVQLNENLPDLGRSSFRMDGGTSTLDAMIAGTPRGLLVTRFAGVRLVDPSSLLCTGVSRDGIWLIENGVVTRPVKNLRFTESPLFMLNNLDAIGQAVPILSDQRPQLSSALVPALKARDFSFTSLVDAT